LEPEEVVTAVVEDGTVNATEEALEGVEVQQEQQGQEPEQSDAGDAAALSLEEKVAQLEVRVTDPEENMEVGTSLHQAGGDDNNATDTSGSSSSNNTETGGAE
jgi:hypothetical protein